MKWGFRRFQNEDGSLKAAGRKRYANDGEKSFNKNSETVATQNPIEKALFRSDEKNLSSNIYKRAMARKPQKLWLSKECERKQWLPLWVQ